MRAKPLYPFPPPRRWLASKEFPPRRTTTGFALNYDNIIKVFCILVRTGPAAGPSPVRKCRRASSLNGPRLSAAARGRQAGVHSRAAAYVRMDAAAAAEGFSNRFSDGDDRVSLRQFSTHLSRDTHTRRTRHSRAPALSSSSLFTNHPTIRSRAITVISARSMSERFRHGANTFIRPRQVVFFFFFVVVVATFRPVDNIIQQQ